MRSLRSVCLAAIVIASGGAAGVAQADVPAPDNDPFYAVPGGLEGMANGSVIGDRAITATTLSIPLPATSWQLKYKTLDNHGTATATVATVMVPTVPYAGSGPRPVVSYQTAEDGVGTKCAPSYALRGGLSAGLSNSSPETFLMLQALQRGWIVLAPDYEGPRSMFLGSDGEAREVLDGLRAARSFAPAGIDPAAPLALWGYSGGALASSTAAQLQPRYAPELKLSGVALGGVVGDLRATIHAFSGSFAGGALVMGFVAVDRSYPEYHLQRYLNDAARSAMANSQSDCINDAAAKYPGARLEQYTNDPGIVDGPILKQLFERINPLTFPGVPAGPVYDYHASGDELAPIGPDRALIDRYCRAGVPVLKREDPIGEHLSEVGAGAPGALSYLADRFAGMPAPNNCTLPPDPARSAALQSRRGALATNTSQRCRTARARLEITSIHTTRTGLAVRGRAAGPCGSALPRLARVTVSFARLAGGRCQFLTSSRRLRAARACRQPLALRARGVSRWALTRAATLVPGRYRIDVRASGLAAGRVSRIVRLR